MSIKQAFALSMAMSFVSGVLATVIFILWWEVLSNLVLLAGVAIVTYYAVGPVTAACSAVDHVVGSALSGLWSRATRFFHKADIVPMPVTP